MSIPHLNGEALPLAAAQKKQAGALLGRAFYQDPSIKFILPEEERRARVLDWYFETTVNYALHFGEVQAASQLQGITGWLPPGQTHTSLWRFIRSGFLPVQFKLGREGYRRMMANESYIDAVHAEQMPGPHWYLWFVAVEPAAKRCGIGSMLIRRKLAQADADHIPCYLETHNLINVAFYEKLGFSVVHTGKIPGSDLQMWGLARG